MFTTLCGPMTSEQKGVGLRGCAGAQGPRFPRAPHTCPRLRGAFMTLRAI